MLTRGVSVNFIEKPDVRFVAYQELTAFRAITLR
jgi:hypothetical protein